ncbi:MAG: hypothetical protein VX265_01380 [Myxococcota bacterium]|nr:hypothetical protein [Myxococcota bacterium]
MRSRRILPWAVALMSAAPAAAAPPNPDRPSFSRTGFLVADRSVELEGGFNWAAGAPAGTLMPKLGLGRLEPRVGIDLFSGGAAFTPGLKVGLLQQSGLGLAAHAHVGVPTGGGGTTGEAGGLLTGMLAGGQVLQANLGVRTTMSDAGVTVVDVPLAGLLGLPLGKRWSAFGEGVLLLRQADAPVQLNTGLGCSITQSMVLDTALSWTPGSNTIGATAGLTANFGQFR